MSKRITINDLAKVLGLSPTLISMVLNGKGAKNKISPITQKKVIDTARKLNYTPNQNARALRTGKSFVIGLIVPDISNPFFSRLARYFEDMLWEHGYRLVMGSTDENPDNEKRLLRLFADQNVDGVIAATTFSDAKAYLELKRSGCKVVMFDRVFENAGIPYVSIRNKEAAYEAVEKLIGLKKKNIGFVTLTPSYISPLKERRAGFLQAMKKFKKPVSDKSICEIRFDEVETNAGKIFGAWFKKNPGIDALLVANNTLTFQLMKFFKETKIKNVPGIISFDDHIAFELASPSITAIDQPVKEIAQKTVELMLAQLDKNPLRKKEVILPGKLILRQSHLGNGK